MSDYKKAVFRAVGLLLAFNALLGGIGAFAGVYQDGNAVGGLLLLVGVVSLLIFVAVCFKLDKQYPRESR